MKIAIDGITYQTQAHGGISHLYDEILPRMCDKDDSLHINILTSGRRKKTLPVHQHIDQRALFPIDDQLHPIRLWKSTRFQIRAYLQHLAYKGSTGEVWHSTYYTRPYHWKGPVVLSVYDLIHERFSLDLFNKPIYKDFRNYRRRCVAEADLVICISEATKKDLEQYLLVDPMKIRVIHLASSSVFRVIENVDCLPTSIASKSFLLYIGGRQSYKNFGNLLKAYSSWQWRNDVDLVVVGGAWSKPERELLKELEIFDQAHLLNSVDDETLCALYNRAIAYIIPSLWEGFGIPLLEAMACGCPIVASNIPSTVEIAQDCPWYFEPKEIDSLIYALDNVINAGRDLGHIQFGLRRVNEFSWDLTATKTLNVYRELVGKS